MEPMKPMFLPDVENARQSSGYLDAIEQMRAAGQEFPQIWHLFAFRPDATQHLARFTQEVMRGPSPLPPGMRELIAAFTSYRNDCPF
jgi:alkylhydroperoxidase family enzyme